MTGSVDPQATVEAPIRRALDDLVVRSAIYFGGAVLALLVTIGATEGLLHGVAHFALPAVLVTVLAARTVSVVMRRGSVATDGAWSRVRAIEPAGTDLATFLAFVVPVAWLIGGGSMLLRHVPHHDLPAVVAIWVPLGLTLWFLTTIAWIHDCRERLARALDESERRFRAYWADVHATA